MKRVAARKEHEENGPTAAQISGKCHIRHGRHAFNGFRKDLLLHSGSSMIKRVLGQPNFSPQTNATQLFPKINTNFNNLSSVKVNTNI